MIKLLLLILIGLLLMFFGYRSLLSDKSINIPGSQNTNYSSPVDTIQGAKGAVQKTQNLQDKIGQETQNQLNQ